MEARTLRPGGLLLVGAIVFSACSSDGGDTTTTAPPATTTTTAETTTAEATTTTTTAEGAGSRVTINNFMFNPGDITVAAGATVTWNNGDGVSHTTTSDEDGWDSGVLGTGDSFETVFAEPGVFTYHCTIHPTMTGTVTVEG